MSILTNLTGELRRIAGQLYPAARTDSDQLRALVNAEHDLRAERLTAAANQLRDAARRQGRPALVRRLDELV